MSELTNQQVFQDKIIERLREDIGSLIPDEVLSELTERAIQNMFFSKQRKADSWGNERQGPSWFESTVESELKDRVKTSLSSYFAQNEEQIQQSIAEGIQESLPKLLAELVRSSFSGAGTQLGFAAGAEIGPAFAASLRNQGLLS